MRAVGPLPEDDGRHVGRHGLPQSPQEGGHAHAEQGRGHRSVHRRDEELPKRASTCDIHTFFCNSAPQTMIGLSLFLACCGHHLFSVPDALEESCRVSDALVEGGDDGGREESGTGVHAPETEHGHQFHQS